jgi:hypothetical protein
MGCEKRQGTKGILGLSGLQPLIAGVEVEIRPYVTRSFESEILKISGTYVRRHIIDDRGCRRDSIQCVEGSLRDVPEVYIHNCNLDRRQYR